MHVIVRACHDRDLFLGEQEDGFYCIFGLEEPGPVAVGDELVGNFTNSRGHHQTVANVTNGGTVRIVAEDWDCPWDRAYRHLREMHHHPAG
jgi:hypothetical protein